MDLVGSDRRLLMTIAFILGDEDDERDEKKRESNGLEKRLSPNAVVLSVLIVLASIDFIVVEVF